ncbi:hypothetical protein [Mesorhizobium sp.]|uniref:hypothetical protein n=1 Tax=Mesorhizobium sp. TaxID=1871066 RepID=UPI0025D18B9C|nr:hypothetical protein [Mesorhizobium sp.]
MTFADKCELLARRRGPKVAPAPADNKLRASLVPPRRWDNRRHPDVPKAKP